MKKIYSFLLTGAALLTLIPIIAADGDDPQREPDYYLNEDGSVGFMKSISEPNTNGVYKITLESFATGESVKISKSIPADIVLVLDYSGSMAQNMSGGTASASNPSRISVMKEAVTAFIEQIDINDKYVKYVAENSPENVARTTPLGNRIAIVTFAGNVNTVAELTRVATGKSTLLQRVDGLNNPSGGTRSDLGLERAFNLLDPLDDTHQLLTTVLFTDGDPGGGSEWDNSTTQYTATETAYTQQYTHYGGPVTVLTTGNDGDLPYSTSSHNGEFTWNTANNAINFANSIKGLANEDKEIFSKVYTVSVVTNPSPYTNVYLGKTSSNYEGSTKMADLNEVTEWYDWSNRQNRYTNSRIRHFVTWNSSNIWANGNGNAIPEADQKYAFATTDAAKLKEVFETIAGESGGGSVDLGEEAVSEVDVVSSSFALPEGTDVSGIEVYIEKCTGRQAPKQYIDIYDNDQVKTGTFLKFEGRKGPINTVTHTNLTGYTYDDDGDSSTPEVPVDNHITVTLGKSGNDPNDPDKQDVINVNGFNYGANWCGPVFEEGHDGEYDHVARWNGYKVVVIIPIEMDKNAVGGPDAPTNADGSGIKVKGNLVAEFKSPKVSLPVNIHIRKEGLDEGESAKFLIERKLVSEDDSQFIEVSSVFVTRHKNQAKDGTNAPITKVVGMPSVDEDDRPFIYRVREVNWNWAYTLTGIKGPDGGAIGNTTTKSALSTELVSNPFIFVNKKKDNIDYSVRHAESKATNTFKTNVTNVGYDDSKNNGRTVITVETETEGESGDENGGTTEP